jgi:lysine 2,3-aminomutase
MRELRRRLSGLALPAYMLDIPGGRGKVPIAPAYIEARQGGGYEVTDPRGEIAAYSDSTVPQ